MGGYFADTGVSVTVFNIAPEGSVTGSAVVSLGPSQLRIGARQGEASFYDGKLCYQEWQSCNSCHPFYRPDGLNWILGGGTVVSPKNTKSMVNSWWTYPPNWAGRHGGPRQSIIAGIELQLYRTPTQELIKPLDTLFMRMKPVPSPYLEKGRLSAAALRGKTLYYNKDKVDCIVCHPPPLFTDNLCWNTAIPDPFDATIQWYTPDLPEAWRTASYGHLGSMTLREIVELPTHSNASKNLTPQEIDDLLAYVLSL